MKFLDIYKLNEYQEIFKSFYIRYKEFQLNELDQIFESFNFDQQKDKVFSSIFENGDIELIKLLMFYYPNYNFKFNQKEISNAIKNNNIHLINYILKNHLNLLKNDNINLINQINSELLNHKNYKFLKFN